ncbi:MAG: DUF2298 domain-containing protein [Chloroflexi bacterium]|nr:DUF2298 domain-containing protein [Chloroflexota bacterium]
MTLIQEWLTREGHLLFSWWLAIALAGAAAFPLCLRLLGGLPDRGYTLSRAIGMLALSFVYWLLTSFGLLENSAGSIALTWVVILFLSLTVYAQKGDWGGIRAWWQENRALVLATELLFLVLFLVWAVYRAHQNAILYTEKPMELAFLSALQRSASFPPDDPWMAGYAISYYYMGYLISAMLSIFSNIGSTVGFNLTAASQFALTGVCAFGVAYNLVRSRAFETATQFRNIGASRAKAMAVGLLAMLFMTLVGNFQPVLIEFPFQSGYASEAYLNFWGTQDRANFAEGGYARDPQAPLLSDPASWSYWWWFRASRVLTDYNLDNSPGPIQPIDEFPAFSFLLADNHPHVLALPFALMTIGLMINIVLLRRQPRLPEAILYGIVVGGLAFLNTWDGPIYLFALVAAEALRRLMLNDRGRLTAADTVVLLLFGLLLAGIALLAYFPFFIGFRSQAGGLLPNLVNPTSFRRFFIMFGPILLILPGFLLVETWRGHRFRRLNWQFGRATGAVVFIGLLLLLIISSVIGAVSSSVMPAVGQLVAASGGWGQVIPLLIGRRIEYGMTTLVLLLGIVLVLARLFPKSRVRQHVKESATPNITYSRATACALLLIGMGLCLTLIPEFVFLKDNFGSRINTIFKFYYQAWTVWSVATAYAIYSVLDDGAVSRPIKALRFIYALLVLLALTAGLVYSVLGIRHRSWIESGRGSSQHQYTPPENWSTPVIQVTLGETVYPGTVLFTDGSLFDATESTIIRSRHEGIALIDEMSIRIVKPLSLDGRDGFINRDDLNVINCLSEVIGRDDAVVAEAVLRAYSEHYGRVGALTGIPIVLGWENHERQWRGSTYYDIAGSRRQDMETLYTAEDISQITHIIDRYQIGYILFGMTEMSQYGGAGEEKFRDHFPVACESNHSRIYAVPRRGDLQSDFFDD